MKYVLLDSDFLIAYFDEKDAYHKNAMKHSNLITQDKEYYLIIPCAVLFEVLNTKFMKNLNTLKKLEKEILNRLNTNFYQHPECKNLAKEQLKERQHGKRISLVDGVLRYILKTERKIDVFVTSNPKDFFDLLKETIQIIDMGEREN